MQTFYYGTDAVAGWNPFADDDDNNGNVRRALHYVPTALDGSGNITSWAMAADAYTYDQFNRLLNVTETPTGGSGSGFVQQYTYDRWGNRTAVTGDTAQSWSTTEAATTNRLKLSSGNTCTGSKNGLCYDAAGNVTFDNQLGASGDRTYDAENRMISATTSNKYVYDADGKRVRRQVGSSQYWQVYGIGGELVAEYSWNGTTATLLKEYGSGGEVSVVAESSAVRWLVTDHLGTPRIIADQTGSLSGITRHDYLPFGEENFAGSVRTGNGYQDEGVRQQFTGYERDDESGLDFAEARYCSSKQGRFTSIDPYIGSAKRVVPQSWNRYSYVINRPLFYVDSDGLLWYRKKLENGDYSYIWSDKELGPSSGWEKVAIGKNGLTILVRGASGALAKYNGHTITFKDDSPVFRDNGVYREPPSAQLAPIPLTQDAGFRALAMYALAAKYLIKNRGNAAAATADVVADAVEIVLNEDATGGVYTLRDPGTSDVMRSGRTNDLNRRRGEHARDPELEDYEFHIEFRTDDYAEQRGLEQHIHDTHTPPFNKINPISERNPNKPEYMRAA